MSVACLRHTRVCLSTLAGCNRGGIPGGTRSDIKRDASASIGTRRVAVGADLGTHLRRPREALAASRGDPVTLCQPRHLIHHARWQPAASARAWLVVPDARRTGAGHCLPGTTQRGDDIRSLHRSIKHRWRGIATVMGVMSGSISVTRFSFCI